MDPKKIISGIRSAISDLETAKSYLHQYPEYTDTIRQSIEDAEDKMRRALSDIKKLMGEI